MKKKLLWLTFPIILIICAVVYFEIQYPRLSFEKLLGINESSITKVSMKNSVNGSIVETDNKDKIGELTNLLNNRTYRKDFKQKLGTGFIYAYDFYSSNNKILTIVGSGNNVHIYNEKRTIDAYYTVSKEITLDSLDNWFNLLLQKANAI